MDSRDLYHSKLFHGLNVTNSSFESSSHQHLKLNTSSFVSLVILYSFTTVFSIFGNVLVIYVFRRGRQSRTELRFFLINLSIADLMMALFCMPFTFADAIYRRWVFPDPVCPFVLFIQIMSVSASVFTNVAIGVDRFLIVMYPLRLRYRLTQKRCKYVISVIWIMATMLASVQFAVSKTHEQHYGRTINVVCNEQWPSPFARRVYSITVFLLIYVLPLLILSITYSLVGFYLWKRIPPGNSHHMRDFLQWKSKIKVVKMLVIILLVFGLCWLPLHIFVLVIDFRPEILTYLDDHDEKAILSLYLAIHWLAMSNSFANPIIYLITNKNFRIDIASVFSCFHCSRCCQRISVTTQNDANRDI